MSAQTGEEPDDAADNNPAVAYKHFGLLKGEWCRRQDSPSVPVFSIKDRLEKGDGIWLRAGQVLAWEEASSERCLSDACLHHHQWGEWRAGASYSRAGNCQVGDSARGKKSCRISILLLGEST